MIAGKICGIIRKFDHLKFVVEVEPGRDVVCSVHRTVDAEKVQIGDEIWTQSGVAMVGRKDVFIDMQLTLYRLNFKGEVISKAS